DPPFVVKTTDGWSGYSVQVFEYLAKTLDLEYEYVEQPNRVYGEMLSDGTWTGIIGQVSSKKVDIGLGPIVKSQERLSVVDFSIPYYESAGLVIVSKREKLNNLPADFFLDFLTLGQALSQSTRSRELVHVTKLIARLNFVPISETYR
ncbi:Glutamate receptor ionotropic kainate 4, partial [Fasciola gigantica]